MTTTLANVRARALRYGPAMLAFAASGVFPMRAEANDALPPVNDAKIAEYRERQSALAADSQAILAKCDAESREPTGEENKLVNENTVEIERLQGLIETRAKALAQIRDLSQPVGRRTTPTGPEPGAQPTPQPSANANPPAFAAARDRGNPGQHSRTFGFGNFGEFALAAMRASNSKGNEVDARLRMALTTYGNEGVGADGGFLVPPESRDRILGQVFDVNSLLSRTDQQVTSRNAISFPTDETTPWGTSGVRGFWTSEAGAITQSKPSFKKLTLETNKLAALVPVTDELLEDAPGLGNYLSSAVGRVFNYLIGHAIIDGNGAGQPLGYLRSGALVTVAAEGGQTADTIVAQNVAKMFVRMPIESRLRSIWIVNPDVEAQLMLMTLGGSAAAFPIYLPPNGFSQSPFSTLLGRPVVPHMAAKALGDVGDISLVDLMSYVTAVKTGGLKTDASMHLFFDQDVMAFRFILRIDGRPWLQTPFNPPNGSSTLSPFIALSAR